MYFTYIHEWVQRVEWDFLTRNIAQILRISTLDARPTIRCVIGTHIIYYNVLYIMYSSFNGFRGGGGEVYDDNNNIYYYVY